jgi:hypothetical protein
MYPLKKQSPNEKLQSLLDQATALLEASVAENANLQGQMIQILMLIIDLMELMREKEAPD